MRVFGRAVRGPLARGGRAAARGALAFAVMAAAAVAPAYARAATLSGRVLRADDGRPVQDAVVRVLETGAARRTDALGHFAFTDLPQGTWTLSAHHLAIAGVERAVRVMGEGTDTLTLVAPPALFEAAEIVVRSERSFAALRASPDPVEEWGAERLRRSPAAGVAEALAAMPGLALARDGAWPTALSVRGLGGAAVVTLVDDTRLETATDLAGALSLVDAAELERVEVVKSPGSVLFGSGALGGAVHFVTRRPALAPTPEWSAALTAGVSGADRGATQHLALERDGPRVAFRASAGLRRAADVRTPAGPLADSHWGDGAGAVSLLARTAGVQTVHLSWQRVQARDAGIPGGRPFSPSAEARCTLARRERFGAEYRVPNAFAAMPLLTLGVSHQEVARNVELLQAPGVRVTPHAIHAVSAARLEARVLPGRGQVLLAGTEAWRRSLDSRRERFLPAPDRVIVERPVPRASYGSAGAWARHEWTTGHERVRVVTGARWDRGRTRNDAALQPEVVIENGAPLDSVPGRFTLWPAGTSDDASWSASLGAHLAVTPAWSVSALIASAWRSPSLEERFQFLDLGSSVRLGDPSLAPEHGLSLDVGTRLEAGRTRVRADLFGHRLTDLVSDSTGTWEGRPATFKANVGTARLYGLEVSLEHEPARRVVVAASVAYVRGEDTGRHADLPQVAPLAARAEAAFEARAAGTFRIACDAQAAQRHAAPGEARTPGWTAWSATFASRELRTGALACRLRGGVANALDRAYRLHLSTLRGEPALEPGRNVWASLAFTLGREGGP